MQGCFETRRWDGAARLGTLYLPDDRTVETPALLPVINPNRQTIQPRELETDFGVEALITNAYIIHGDDDLRDRAVAEGLHELLEFDGVIMTDSGSFQLAEYGEIDVTTPEILQFQRTIGTDIATPVDIPTDPDASRETAEADLEVTMERLGTAAETDTGDMLVTAPVQGGRFPDVRERAGRHAAGTGLDIFPIGGVVPLLNEYRFETIVDVVTGAKRGLGPAAPVHLFGAGHPMMFALAVALGCDLFDSAAYAIYARDDRYMTVGGTVHLEQLEDLPCTCTTCAETTPEELRTLADEDRARALSAHNLAVSLGEIRRIRQAIRDGDLMELVDRRSRSHPALLDGYRALLEHRDFVERTDPVSKGTMFITSHESARRPEVSRYHDRLSRLAPPETLLVTDRTTDSEEHAAVWRLRPPFGPVPPALGQTYPLTAEVPARPDRAALESAADGVAALVECHPQTQVTLEHHNWPPTALDRVPKTVSVIDIGEAP